MTPEQKVQQGETGDSFGNVITPEIKEEENKSGRPTKYKPEMCETIVELMREGASKTEVCAEIGISKETMKQWTTPESDYYVKEFSDSVKQGVELSKAWWLKKGRIGIDADKFNATPWVFNMKNRFGWRDKTETDITSKGEKIEGLAVTFKDNE